MKKFLIIIVFFISSCGYQPLYIKNNDSELIFKEINLLGNKQINRKIVSFVSIKEEKNNDKLNNLTLKSDENIDETSKDSKGKVSTFKTNIEVRLTISDKNGIIREKVFFKDFSYNNKDNKFDLIEYQKEIKNNLIDKIIEEMIVFFKIK